MSCFEFGLMRDVRFLEARSLLVVFLNFVTVFYNSLQLFNNRILQFRNRILQFRNRIRNRISHPCARGSRS